MNPWILAIRPRTLPAAIGPLLVGNVLALQLEQFSSFIAVISMLCALLLQIAVNLANDYFDFKSGVDTEERLGPVRVTQSGMLSPTAVRNAMILCLVLALIVGSFLIYHGGIVIAFLAAAAILGALGYSGGPYPLASHGLGEVAAFVFFGLVAVVGSYFLQAGDTATSAWLLGSAIGFLNAAIMLVNNTRDMETDIKAGKKTLAVRMGLEQSRIFYQSFVYLPFAIIIAGFFMGALPGMPVLLAGLAFIMARNLSRDFNEVKGAALNPLLGRTAKLTMIFSALFSAGLLIDILLG
ncbi:MULTISPECIES: 1,4-dihydroxy-2-naphthoate polyprenyltransferase [Shewanella]|uniref:1,4-dihydroxy-2-naphthoate octaprenyltransferase n=1 Tax=Shewanella fidelis TaxID=173509 RepID=A0AAW8NIL1_9GAMM|nr:MULTISPECIES: 1,4-dihydroxy-2-naphthoate polyprenyltransferase [Shewanella]MDR8523139.1 1,4-dihydroxy-2-naphthoate polyprenyltransferase [Shewanella fidelis]MDW4811535.1 1,4-dihydroxy-2-naphthoate polyprenyltransferase [Shewanella fidelis]MDW4815656.1 1,4-dihydroxy-2-naphthoate polyprenyltransferase [Shewanella fidelis]MDW4819746.1 1,4-dihydroxy-2-naphthoate polyprenyltransferase [Shewanella fidelis]MDW4824280.1 1,4-dihydroxy-2-naphthoate polyprenyltransferase [Shewanella fidelis]